jgi:hypothetical protein
LGEEVIMGLLDSMKDRFSANLKLTRLAHMTQSHEIIAFCRSLTADERARIIAGIESQFKWQSVSQVAQALFPSYNYGAGVSAEALDMVKSGQISGGLELMRWENQPAMQQQWGFTPAQQASLSFAWTVLKAIEQSASAASYQAAAASGAPANTGDAIFCTSCGARRAPGLYCSNCGTRF